MLLADFPFLLARETFARYRLRTVLGMAGIVCGVAVALAMGAVNEGAREAALADVARLGTNTVAIRSRAPDGLSARDVTAIAQLLPSIMVTVPLVHAETTIAGPHGTVPAVLLATTAAYARLADLAVADGRFLRADEDDRGPRVCVLGRDVSRMVFEYDNPLGASVRVGWEWYRVVGVVERSLLDRSVVVPLAAYAGRVLSLDPTLPFDELRLRVDADRRMDGVAADVQRLLARRHARRVSDYEVTLPRELLDHRTSTQRLFSIMSGTTAALLLMLGGIGIMNAMLTAVVERTREIGLRRAVGATRGDIVRQFLTEAAMIASAGGAGGLVTGLALSLAIARAGRWPVAFSISTAAGVLLVSTAVGLLSGIYPAIRAARGAPIDAVIHE